jgi:hypothetical protein
MKHEEGQAYKLMLLIEEMRDTLKRFSTTLGKDNLCQQFDDVITNAFEFWTLLFLDTTPELPEALPPLPEL